MSIYRYFRWIVGSLTIFSIGLIFAAYHFKWTGAGFSNKTFWDWMQLLIIPIALAVVAIWFNRVERRNEQAIASDNQQEAALQSYFDKISELLLRENLRESTSDTEVQVIARVWTLTVLRRLDNERKGNILKFLYESGLIEQDEPIIRLDQANLAGADLKIAYLKGAYLGASNLDGANLQGASLVEAKLLFADLIRADLSEADLQDANLAGTDLSGANLSKTDMQGANLHNANLNGADLKGAKITEEQLKDVKSLKGTILPDGSKHA